MNSNIRIKGTMSAGWFQVFTIESTLSIFSNDIWNVDSHSGSLWYNFRLIITSIIWNFSILQLLIFPESNFALASFDIINIKQHSIFIPGKFFHFLCVSHNNSNYGIFIFARSCITSPPNGQFHTKSREMDHWRNLSIFRNMFWMFFFLSISLFRVLWLSRPTPSPPK